MTRFIQQQIPPQTTRSIPQTPCQACGASVLVGSTANIDKTHSEVKPSKKKKK